MTDAERQERIQFLAALLAEHLGLTAQKRDGADYHERCARRCEAELKRLKAPEKVLTLEEVRASLDRPVTA